MIRFLVGCLLAIVVLWAAFFTLTMCTAFLMGFTKNGHHGAVHQPVRQ